MKSKLKNDEWWAWGPFNNNLDTLLFKKKPDRDKVDLAKLVGLKLTKVRIVEVKS